MLSAPLSAWDWPVENPDVSVSFLAPYHGEYATGTLLTSRTSDTVHASNTGTVHFVSDYVTHPKRQHPPHVLGGMIIVENPNQFYTLYSDVQSRVQSGAIVRKGDIIANLDQRRNRNGVYTMIIDQQQQQLLNPLLLFPRLNDRLRPTVTSFETIPKYSPVIGDYFNVRVQTFDRRVFSNAIAPVLPPFVSVSYHNQQHAIFLDSVYSDAGYLYNNATRMRAEDIFTPSGEFILGPFIIAPAQEQMTIQIFDYLQLSRTITASIYDDE